MGKTAPNTVVEVILIMLNIGETVVFGTEGIFTVEETTQKVIGGQKTDYYVLRSTNKANSVVYLPMNNQDLIEKAKPLLTKEEITRLIENIPNSEDCWVDDHKQRKEKFNRILQSGDRENIIALAGTIYNKQKAQIAAHKKLNASDERILREAERIINLEFAFVLNITPDEVKEYIRKRMILNGTM